MTRPPPPTRSIVTLAGRLALLGLLGSASVVPAAASAQVQERGSREIGRPVQEKEGDVPISRYIFAGIGIDAYDAPWEPLDNAVNDVDSVRAVFVDEFGFDSPDEWVLHTTCCPPLCQLPALCHLVLSIQTNKPILPFC